MNKPLAILVTALISLGCLSQMAAAQQRGGKKPNKQSGDTLRNYMLKQGKPVVLEDPGETYMPGTPVPIEKRVAVKGLGKFVQPFVGTDPGRLAPGQSGELRIILALKKIYVFQEGVHLTLRYRHKQGPISFGDWTLLPAMNGRLDTVYQGLPVYDNTATIVMPVSIAGVAAYAERPVGFEVEVDVTNGQTGIFQGRYTMDVRGKVLIGRPLPVILENLDAESSSSSDQAGVVSAAADDPRGEVADGASATRSAGARPALLVVDERRSLAGDVGSEDSEAELADLGESEAEDQGSSLLIYSVPIALLLLILGMALGRAKGRA